MNQLDHLLASIATAAAHTPACGNDAEGDRKPIAWSNEAALRQIYRLTKQAQAVRALETHRRPGLLEIARRLTWRTAASA